MILLIKVSLSLQGYKISTIIFLNVPHVVVMVRYFYLFFSFHVAEVKAPGVSPDSVEHLKVFEKVCSPFCLGFVSHRPDTWESKHVLI